MHLILSVLKIFLGSTPLNCLGHSILEPYQVFTDTYVVVAMPIVSSALVDLY